MQVGRWIRFSIGWRVDAVAIVIQPRADRADMVQDRVCAKPNCGADVAPLRRTPVRLTVRMVS